MADWPKSQTKKSMASVSDRTNETVPAQVDVADTWRAKVLNSKMTIAQISKGASHTYLRITKDVNPVKDSSNLAGADLAARN